MTLTFLNRTEKFYRVRIDIPQSEWISQDVNKEDDKQTVAAISVGATTPSFNKVVPVGVGPS
jgi:hypothetical protein